MKSIIYIGVGVHKKMYGLCAIYENTGGFLEETKIETNVKLIEKFITNTKKKVNDLNIKVKTNYEAGGLEYSLYYQLT